MWALVGRVYKMWMGGFIKCRVGIGRVYKM